MSTSFRNLLSPERLTEVVDIGANPIDGDPPYKPMLAAELCQVTGFEPQHDALLELQSRKGPHETYLPYAVGDGGTHTLNICNASGMTSLFEPDPAALNLFNDFSQFGEVTARVVVETRRLDDITEIEQLDFLKIDIQGGELAVFKNGKAKLAEAVAIQTEVSFVPLYKDQPTLGDIDLEMRSQGFVPHCFAAIKPWATTAYGAENKPPRDHTQLLEADLVYVRDLARPESLSDEQLKHLALIAHHCYRSFDLAMHCVMLLEERQVWGAGAQPQHQYRQIVTAERGGTVAGSAAGSAVARPAGRSSVETEGEPTDARAVFERAQGHFNQGDFANARKWYARRIEMGGWQEEVYAAMFFDAVSMAELGEPWPDVSEAYLQAWAFRPTRAEPLHAIARRYRIDGCFHLGYMFGQLAAEIPYPHQERLALFANTYDWRVDDELAICASQLGKHTEAFALCRKMLARSDLPADVRQRIAENRDLSVPALIDAALSYPDVLAGSLAAGPRDAKVTVSLTAGGDLAAVEQTLNSFLHCCQDVHRVGRFLLVDDGLSAKDRAALEKRYGFLEFVDSGPGLDRIRAEIGGRYWLHLGQGWRFFAPEKFIARLTAVLDADTRAVQVAINFGDAAALTRASAPEEVVRRGDRTGRYVLADAVASGPAMFDTERLDRAGGIDGSVADPIAELGRTAAKAGLHTVSLDEVLCIAG